MVKELHKKWSVWAAALLGVVAMLEPQLPEISKHLALPPRWAAYFAVAIIVLRAIKQPQ